MSRASAAMLPHENNAQYEDARYIVSVREGFSPGEVMSDHEVSRAQSTVFTEVVNAFAANLTGEQAEELMADPRVFALDVNEVVRRTAVQTAGPSGTFSTPNATMPWGLDRIDQRTAVVSADASKQSFTYTHTGAGVKAYIMDSGMKADHPEFAGRVATGWSYRAISQNKSTSIFNALGSCKVNDPANNYTYNAADHIYDVDTFDQTYTPGDVGSPDNDGHGTHVAGTVGGTISGVAKGTTLVPVRVLNSCGGGNTETVLLGLQWIATQHSDGELAVVNMSIGFNSSVTSINTAITTLLEEGVVVTAAAGNSGSATCGTPAATYGTISVGASNYFDNEPYYTNYGTCVDIFAPGSLVLSASFKDKMVNNVPVADYRTISGTSMAAPHVAGIAAIVLETHPEIQTNQALLQQDFSGRKIGRTMFVWNWIKTRATKNVINYYDSNRASQTPNLLVNLSSPVTPTGFSVSRSGTSAVMSWAELAEQEGRFAVADVNDVNDPYRNAGFNDITYTVTAQPGNLTCTSKTTSCTINGLIDGVSYSVSVRANNLIGDSPESEVIPVDVTPNAPLNVLPTVKSKAVVLRWDAVGENITYVVTEATTGKTCITTETTCTISGLANGTEYSFSVVSKNSTGAVSAAPTVLVARPGFVVKKTAVAKKSKTLLTSIVTTPSRGVKKWSESGKCSIVKGRLVAPKTATTCSVVLRVAKKGAYPAMKTTVKVKVS